MELSRREVLAGAVATLGVSVSPRVLRFPQNVRARTGSQSAFLARGPSARGFSTR